MFIFYFTDILCFVTREEIYIFIHKSLHHLSIISVFSIQVKIIQLILQFYFLKNNYTKIN